jgi:glycosyltransferase involved in cell wall biosynthesis
VRFTDMTFSVIIPTYNRWKILKRTLQGYLEQNALELIKEIIIIDDGSREKEDRFLKNLISKAPFSIHILRQENQGPAAARNLGIRQASGDILFFTGDDIIPHQDLVKTHYASHHHFDLQRNLAVLGRTVWFPEKKVSPFMHYIQEKGFQFGYALIKDENDVPFKFFYTSNISIQRSFLAEEKTFFDLEFPYAAFEDIELAYRLKRRGLRIIYNREAIGYHDHPISLASFRKRMELCGYSACIFCEKHPELDPFLGVRAAEKPSFLFDFAAKGIEPFCLLADKYLPRAFPLFYKLIMQGYYKKGIRRYKKLFPGGVGSQESILPLGEKGSRERP